MWLLSLLLSFIILTLNFCSVLRCCFVLFSFSCLDRVVVVVVAIFDIPCLTLQFSAFSGGRKRMGR